MEYIMNEILVNGAGLLVQAEIILEIMILLSLDTLSISKTQVLRIIFPIWSQFILKLPAEVRLYISGLDFQIRKTIDFFHLSAW